MRSEERDDDLRVRTDGGGGGRGARSRAREGRVPLAGWRGPLDAEGGR